MMLFKDLNIGDMFNTAFGRYVKVTYDEGIYVHGANAPIGQRFVFRDSNPVIPLYTMKKQ